MVLLTLLHEIYPHIVNTILTKTPSESCVPTPTLHGPPPTPPLPPLQHKTFTVVITLGIKVYSTQTVPVVIRWFHLTQH